MTEQKRKVLSEKLRSMAEEVVDKTLETKFESGPAMSSRFTVIRLKDHDYELMIQLKVVK